MCCAESTRVPSQSNTNRSNRLPIAYRAWRTRGFQRSQKTSQIGWEWSFHNGGLIGLRVAKLDPGSVEEHPLESGTRQHLVEREVAVFVIARDREADVRQLHPDLVSAASQQIRLEQRIARQAQRPPK